MTRASIKKRNVSFKGMDCTATRACPSCALLCAASRVNPTCGVKPGNDGGWVNATVWRSHLDKDLSVFNDRGISLDRNHAWRPDNRTGLDIELPAVKIALDNVAFDEAFRQRARAVRAQ
jgi:hypothetical protein